MKLKHFFVLLVEIIVLLLAVAILTKNMPTDLAEHKKYSDISAAVILTGVAIIFMTFVHFLNRYSSIAIFPHLKKCVEEAKASKDYYYISNEVERLNDDKYIRLLFFLKKIFNPLLWIVIVWVCGALVGSKLAENFKYSEFDYYYTIDLIVCVIVWIVSGIIYSRSCRKLLDYMDKKAHVFFCNYYGLQDLSSSDLVKPYYDECYDVLNKRVPKSYFNYPLANLENDIISFAISYNFFEYAGKRSRINTYQKRVYIIKDFELLPDDKKLIVNSSLKNATDRIKSENDLYIFNNDSRFNRIVTKVAINSFGKFYEFKYRAFLFMVLKDSQYSIVKNFYNTETK